MMMWPGGLLTTKGLTKMRIFIPSVLVTASSHVTAPSKLLSSMDWARDMGRVGGAEAMTRRKLGRMEVAKVSVENTSCWKHIGVSLLEKNKACSGALLVPLMKL